MSISGRNAPLSPISVGGSEWSVSKYQTDDGGGPFPPHTRSNLASPPISGGFSTGSNMSISGGFPMGPGPPRPGGAPSPPASIAGRSSMGAGAYARSESARNSTREIIDDSVLSEHYHALKLFLQSRDPNAKPPPNKARDKLLRLSSVQFYELSTDVYDELKRRQATARTPPNAPNMPPAFLLPEKTFHPKRNQARQRLSSLGPPRFRDLAADVFHELERRFPRFLGGDIPRGGSSMSMRGPPMRNGTPVNGNGYGPRGPRMRQPSDAGSMRGPPPHDAYGIPPSPGLSNGDFGRPMQKQLNQNNTIVPNKSTMVEDDDGVDDDAYGLAQNRESKRSAESSETDKKLIEDYQSQLRELREKLDGMEDAMKKKEDDMNAAASSEKEEWADVRRDLEDKVAEAQSLRDSMKQELDRMRDDHYEETNQLREETEQLRQQLQSAGSVRADPGMQQENDELRDALQEQRRITDEVRREAQQHLQEMRMLSQQSSSTYEKQLELEKTVEQLEHDAQHWKSLYTRTKTQLRNMRASSIGLNIEQDAARMVKGFTSERGIIKDIHVTKFQIAIDDVLQRARTDSPEKVIDAMKSVVVCVRRITKEVDQSQPTDENFAQHKGKLKARVSMAANNFITSSKNFAVGAGLSPVSLLDASASHLTAAMVELLRGAKIRPTPAEELEDEEEDDEGTPMPAESTGFFSPRNTTHMSRTQDTLPPPPPFQGLGRMRASNGSSAYSPVSSPRESVEPQSRRGTNGMGYAGYNKATTNGYHDDKSHNYYDL